MPVQKLCDLADGTVLDADIVIVGGGACGLTLARSLSGRGLRVVIVESGGQTEDADHEQLNAVEMSEGLWSKLEADLRDKYHRNLTTLWNGETQPYGVRCRGLGGATQAWAGKSAPFEKVDFAVRDWVPNSGWPISAESLEPYIERASELLNLGPRIYDETLWTHMGRRPPEPTLSTGTFRTMFWQFARSRRTPTDIIRFGADFLADPPSDVHVLTEATVTRLLSTDDGTAFVGLEAKSLTQRSITIRAASCVLAASAIENARLLLVSRDADPAGLGNKHDCVGRYLMDHPTATIARAQSDQIADMAARFGLTGFREKGHTYVYMQGLGLSEAFQRVNNALNGAVFVTEERASDDPFSALRRLLRRRSDTVFGDVLSIIRSPVRLVRGATARAVERGYLPKAVTRFIVDVALRLFPNTVAQDYQNGTLPLKLSGLRFEATTEQPPDPENRVTLSDSVDVFGVPRARIFWRPGAAARANLHRIGMELSDCFSAVGIARPILEDWVVEGSPDAGAVIDLGHSMGTTRMSDSPQTGVVDRNCEVHGVSGLFAAGGSVFTTSGHANPTLMMLALTLRLSDTLTQKHTAI